MPVTFTCRYCGFHAAGEYGAGAGYLPPKGWIVSQAEVECPRIDCKENFRKTPTRQTLKPLAVQHPMNGTKKLGPDHNPLDGSYKKNLCLGFKPDKKNLCFTCGCSEYEHGLMKEMAAKRDSVPG